MYYFTSDLHLNHDNIIKYCKRPFNDVRHMNETLIHNWNRRVNDDDTVYVVGDLCMGPPHQWAGLINQLNGNICLILGNHDNKKYYQYLPKIIEVVSWREIIADDHGEQCTVMAHHFPPEHTKANPNVSRMNPDLFLCGHVHEHWKIKKHNGITVYNVGVDVNNFTPITFQEIVDEINEARGGN